MALSEFELIQRYFTRALSRDDVVLGVGDDAALLRCRSGMELAVSVDTMVDGVHFPRATTPEDIGYKALAVNLSDMAAMGAEPAWATLALTLPNNDEAWLDGFARGFFSLAQLFNVALIGGDTTRGPLTITVQIHGWVPQGHALRRAGACVGDAIFVSGTLGDAGVGLACVQQSVDIPRDARDACVSRLNRPTPRVRLGAALRGIAHAAIDVSDGFAADLGHVLDVSGCGARVDLSALPLSPALRPLLQRSDGLPALSSIAPQTWSTVYDYALSAGDDYELVFTAAPAEAARIEQLSRELDVAVTRIGTIEAECGLRLTTDDGRVHGIARRGYRHF